MRDAHVKVFILVGFIYRNNSGCSINNILKWTCRITYPRERIECKGIYGGVFPLKNDLLDTIAELSRISTLIK